MRLLLALGVMAARIGLDALPAQTAFPVAEAESAELRIDKTELDDARWFSPEEIAEALSGAPDAPFQPPPRAAIARTLLERWLSA